MMPLEMYRRFYAEEIAAVSNLRNASIVEALASVPRERFLGAGPWTVRGDADFQAPPRRTPDADPRRVYHNYAVAIDEGRQLFNGAPGLLAMARLGLRPGDRVMHLGSATGYYTAVIAHCVGPSGRVVAFEVDAALAAGARANLTSMPWVDVQCADGSGPVEGQFDAMLINAGITHPLDSWLDALAEGGRVIFPLTVAVAPTIGKGPMILATRTADPLSFEARVAGFVAIYSAVGLRDEAMGPQLGAVMGKNPFPSLKRLRRDLHEPSAACWFHRPGGCLSTE
jgi:protein-L-isoaspartate(D-aspartate) O-methyltransferase